MIGKLKVNYQSVGQTAKEEYVLSFKICGGHNYAVRSIIRDLKKLAAEGKEDITMELKPYKSARTNAQNRYMWAMLTEIAHRLNAGRTGGITPEDCYCDMIEEYGAKYTMVDCENKPEVLDELKKRFRAIRIMPRASEDRLQIKVFYGSSTYNTKEMTELIEGIKDRCAELGIDTENHADIMYWERECKRYERKESRVRQKATGRAGAEDSKQGQEKAV